MGDPPPLKIWQNSLILDFNYQFLRRVPFLLCLLALTHCYTTKRGPKNPKKGTQFWAKRGPKSPKRSPWGPWSPKEDPLYNSAYILPPFILSHCGYMGPHLGDLVLIWGTWSPFGGPGPYLGDLVPIWGTWSPWGPLHQFLSPHWVPISVPMSPLSLSKAQERVKSPWSATISCW